MQPQGYWAQFNQAAAPVLGLAQAIALFDALADDPGIAHGYFNNGCSARTHIMCRQMVERHLLPQKLWAFETDDKRLSIPQFPNDPDHTWCFHVAPVLQVFIPDEGKVWLVFDPGIFDGPVRMADWLKAMQADESSCRMTPLGVPPSPKGGDYNPGDHKHCFTSHKTDKDARLQMKMFLKWQKEQLQGRLRILLESPLRQRWSQRHPELPMRGKSWVPQSMAHTIGPPEPAIIPALVLKIKSTYKRVMA